MKEPICAETALKNGWLNSVEYARHKEDYDELFESIAKINETMNVVDETIKNILLDQIDTKIQEFYQKHGRTLAITRGVLTHTDDIFPAILAITDGIPVTNLPVAMEMREIFLSLLNGIHRFDERILREIFEQLNIGREYNANFEYPFLRISLSKVGSFTEMNKAEFEKKILPFLDLIELEIPEHIIRNVDRISSFYH